MSLNTFSRIACHSMSDIPSKTSFSRRAVSVGCVALAGLLAAARAGSLPPRADDEALVVLLTGVDRAWSPPAA